MNITRVGAFVLITGAAAGMSGCSTFQNGYERLYQMLDAHERLSHQPPPVSEPDNTMSYAEFKQEWHRMFDETPAKQETPQAAP